MVSGHLELHLEERKTAVAGPRDPGESTVEAKVRGNHIQVWKRAGSGWKSRGGCGQWGELLLASLHWPIVGRTSKAVAVGSMDQPSFTSWYWVGRGLDTGLLGGTRCSPLPDKLLTLVFPP